MSEPEKSNATNETAKPVPQPASVDAVTRHRNREAWSLTPEQRWQRFGVLQNQAMENLRSNPEALAAFTERNYRKRNQTNVKILERKMRGLDGENVSVGEGTSPVHDGDR